MFEKFKNLTIKEKVSYILGIILFLVMLIIQIRLTIVKILLFFAAIWILPITQYLLHRFNIYLSDIVIYLISVICVVISILLVVLFNKPKETGHQHTISDWIYDKETGLEYKQCNGCGEIFEKRVPNITYSTQDPNVTDNPYIDEEDKAINGNEDEDYSSTTTIEPTSTPKPTKNPNEGEKRYDDSDLEANIEEHTKD